jgi:enoyl-CoA hydratase
VSADKAMFMGLVHDVFADETFEEDVMKFCRHLTKQDGEQMGTAKIAIELCRDVGRDQARHVERLANSALMLGPDYAALIGPYLKGIGKKS